MSLLSRYYPLLSLFFLLVLFTGCQPKESGKGFVIGFSQCVESDAWRKSMLEEMKRELSFHSNISFLYRQADGNSQKQAAQVAELLKEKIDLLIISPNEAEPLTPVVEKAFRQGIPVIVVDRKISTPLYSAYVGGDNYEIGKIAGEYAAHLLNGKGRIIEITGLPKSSPAIERHKGFTEALKTFPSIAIARQVNGEWLKEKAQTGLSEAFNQHPEEVDLIFAHNDRMALGAYEVYKTKGMAATPKIMGVDGLYGPDAGLELVAGKVITATLLYPTGGQEAIMTAVNILEGNPYKKEIRLPTTIIDSSNVRILKLQNQKMLAQQKDIDRRQTKIEQQLSITRNQTSAIYTVSILLLIAVLLGSVTYYYLRENRKINRKLKLQNEEILSQRNELIDLSAKAKAANEAKVNFFTNISHELRTPLTLILGPLEEISADTRLQSAIRQNLALIHKNVIRLLRLVSQLMDFRKIEVEKMRLRASENDLISFTSDILQSYQSIARKRSIDLRLIAAEGELKVWFDVNMLDKVIFNLLSNAFKFTPDNGFIHIYIARSQNSKEAVIKVEDNGIGMTEEAAKNAFGLFYQGEYDNHKGSGIGLALSKELVKLHRGTISVQSEKGKGTSFEILLPLGKQHLEDRDLTGSITLPLFQEEAQIYTAELHTQESTKSDGENGVKEKEHTLLLIEDNEDLRLFIKTRLSGEYEIAEAENGQAALQQGFDIVPDLIISDVLIPGKDGMALVSIFKTDIRTSHIPIILLTGKTGIEHQIEGLKARADAYITKPFNVGLLEQTVKSLLSNRAILKEHFTAELPANLKTQTIGKLDRKFISEFTSLIENNLSNEAFTIGDICKKIGISRVQLYRKVKALLNINVNDYILTIRLQKAKYLLQHEELSISEIAYQTGFSSPAYFSTVFKSKFGITPKAFKEK